MTLTPVCYRSTAGPAAGGSFNKVELAQRLIWLVHHNLWWRMRPQACLLVWQPTRSPSEVISACLWPHQVINLPALPQAIRGRGLGAGPGYRGHGAFSKQVLYWYWQAKTSIWWREKNQPRAIAAEIKGSDIIHTALNYFCISSDWKATSTAVFTLLGSPHAACIIWSPRLFFPC